MNVYERGRSKHIPKGLYRLPEVIMAQIVGFSCHNSINLFIPVLNSQFLDTRAHSFVLLAKKMNNLTSFALF
jgi:hypothetical protein